MGTKLSTLLRTFVAQVKRAPTKASATLDGTRILIEDFRHGPDFPIGYGATFLDAKGESHTVAISLDVIKKQPVLTFDGARMKKIDGVPLVDPDTHWFKFSLEFRWKDETNTPHLLKIAVSKNPFG